MLGESRRMAGLKVRESLSYVHEGRSLSIVTKLLVLDDETLVLPGHGERTTIGLERRTNPFLEGLTP